jgi:hypothetical protein
MATTADVERQLRGWRGWAAGSGPEFGAPVGVIQRDEQEPSRKGK